MAIAFNREEVARWERLSDDFLIDFRTTIGKGSYGVVYRGYSKSKDSLIAIKVVKSTEISRREIDTLRSLSSLDHQNIMGFYGEIQLNGNTFLLLEYCNKGTLAELIKEGIPELLVLKLFRELIEGMCYMNAREKMHRDFKPQNVLIGPEMDIKICDFGLAQTTKKSIYVTGKMGTPIYAAPEVFLIHNKDVQTYTNTCDVWSGGLILYQMLEGEKLFKEVKDYNELKEEWLMYERGIKSAFIKKGLHPLWEYFVNFMLQFDYQKRPTFQMVLEKLKSVYTRMHEQIKGHVNVIEELKLSESDRFIKYQIAKYQVLVIMCEKFTKEDIRMNNEYKYACMFMCLLRYTLFAKNFIRTLRYKRIKNDERDLLPSEDRPEVEMFCDRSRFILEHRYEFYSSQLRNTIVTKILDKYCHRPESAAIMQQLEEVVGVVNKFNKNQNLPDAEELREIFRIVIVNFKKGKDLKKRFNLEEMRLYVHLLLSVLLEEKFPQGEFERLNVESEVGSLAVKSREQLQKLIDNMHEEIDR